MQRFKSRDRAQRLLFAHSFMNGHFRPCRHLLRAASYHKARSQAFKVWTQETCARDAEQLA